MSEFDGLMEEGIVQNVVFGLLDRGRVSDDLDFLIVDCPLEGLESCDAGGTIARTKINQCVGHEVWIVDMLPSGHDYSGTADIDSPSSCHAFFSKLDMEASIN